MTERKVVGRTIAIVLGLVCIILAAGMVVALAAYLPTGAEKDTLTGEIAEKEQTITSLNNQITTLQNTITNLNANAAQATTLQAEIDDLEAQIQSLYNVLYLNATAILVNTQTFDHEPSTNVTIWDGSVPLQYAGYVTVQIESSSNQTHVELAYASHGIVYDSVVTIENGTASFPVLPGSVIITLGNTEPNNRVTGTVTALYYY